jgi:hypothetical protein
MELPAEAKLSAECAFMAVTSYSGEVKLVKLPSIINPARESDEA